MGSPAYRNRKTRRQRRARKEYNRGWNAMLEWFDRVRTMTLRGSLRWKVK